MVKDESMQCFKDSQHPPTLTKVPVSQKQGEKNNYPKIVSCVVICQHLKPQTPPQSWLLSLSPIPKAGKRGSMSGTDTHLTSRGNLNISCSLFLSCLLAVSLSCPHLCISVCQYIFSCLPSDSLCPPVLLSYLVNLCLGVHVNLVFSVNCQSLSKTKLVIPYKWGKCL